MEDRRGWLARFIGPQPGDATADAVAAMSDGMAELCRSLESSNRELAKAAATLRSTINRWRDELPRHQRGEFDQRMNGGECALDILADLERRDSDLQVH